MKQAFLLCLLLLCVTSCSDFSHLHYRHLKKVPAQAEVKPLVSKIKEPAFLPPADSSSTKETSPFIPGTQNEDRPPAAKRIRETTHQFIPPPLVKKERAVFSKNKKAKAAVKSSRPGLLRAIFLVLLLLLLLGLFVAGIWIFINGIIFVSLWLIALGLVMALLALVPVLGVFMAMGDRTPSEIKQYD